MLADALIVQRRFTGAAARYQVELADLDETNVAALVRQDSLGDLNLQPAVDRLRAIREIVAGLDGQDEMYLPASLLSEITPHLSQVLEQRNRMRDYSLSNPEPDAIRDRIITALENERDWFAREVTPLTAVNRGDPAAELAALRATRAQADADAADLRKILTEVRPKAGAEAARELSTKYAAQAGGYARQAVAFLAVAIGGAVVAVLGGLDRIPWVTLADTSRVDLTRPSAPLEFAVAVGPRVFVVGVALYVVRFASRNYGVNRHLQVVNEHRRNALDTFVLFTESPDNAAARSAVTLELVRAVFKDPPTGYVNDHPAEAKIGLPGGFSVSADTRD